MDILQPPGWTRPRGYANGIAAKGTMVFVSGMIGWDAQGKFRTTDFAGQVRRRSPTSSWYSRKPAHGRNTSSG